MSSLLLMLLGSLVGPGLLFTVGLLIGELSLLSMQLHVTRRLASGERAAL